MIKLPSTGVKQSFTLIELLVVITIIAFAVGIAIPSFSSFTKTRRLVEASKEVKSTLRDAQSRASSSIDGDNWGVHFARGATSIELFRTSSATSLSYNSAGEKITHQLPSGVSISYLSTQSANHINVVFTVLKGSVHFAANNGSCSGLGGSADSGCTGSSCLSIGLQGSGQNRYIKVNERNIYESGTQACP